MTGPGTPPTPPTPHTPPARTVEAGRPDGPDRPDHARSPWSRDAEPPVAEQPAEPEDEVRPGRFRRRLRLGRAARVGIVLALLLWVVAAYWAVTPLEVPTSQGPPFGCGTALDHPGDDFGRNVCGRLNDRTALKAGAFAVAGLVVLVGGFLVTPRREAD